MNLSSVFKNYFNGFQEVLNFKNNDNKINALGILKILSYFTVVIPLSFVAAYGAASLYGRISKKQCLSPHDKDVNTQAEKIILKISTPLSVEKLPLALTTMYNDLFDEKMNSGVKRLEKHQEYSIDGLGVNVIVNMKRIAISYPEGVVVCCGRGSINKVELTITPANEEIEQVLTSYFKSKIISIPMGGKDFLFDEVVINGKKMNLGSPYN